jgi:voltage-gated potassium channel
MSEFETSTLGRLRRLADRQLTIDSWDRPGLSPMNWILVGLIFSSVVLFTLETEPSLAGVWADALNTANLLILCVFGIEFLLRLWAAGETKGIRGVRERSRYAGRFWLIVDFLAFAPELLIVALVSAGIEIPISVEGLKAIRLIRLVKLARFVPAAQMLVEVVQSVWRQLLISFFLSLTSVYFAAVAIYYAEGSANAEHFGSISRSLWWAVVTLTTVGYGDAFPVTGIGRLLAGAIALIGIGIIALPSGIIAGAFMERLEADRRSKQRNKDQ